MNPDLDVAWITVTEAAALEAVSPEEIHMRCMPSYPARIIHRVTPKGRAIDLRSLSPDAHNAWLRQQVRLAWERRYGSRRPEREIEAEVTATPLVPPTQVDIVLKRLRAVQKAKEDHLRLGYHSRTEYLSDIAREEGTAVRTIQRWESSYGKGGIDALVDKAPGPPRSGHVSLHTWMKTCIERDWVWGKLTKVQCYRSLVKRAAQLDPEHKKYRVPSSTTVSAFIRDLGPFLHAYRKGPEAVKRAFKGIYRAMGPSVHVLTEYPTEEATHSTGGDS
jgi:hypothetical protein